MDYKRQDVLHRSVDERVKDYFEINVPHPEEVLLRQAARCMDCGIPFCHGIGCPLKNRIPEFNDLIYAGRWERANEVLHSTNNFPEFTGRVCPALCEASCTLNLNDDPVLICHIELQIVERAFAEGWIKPQPAAKKTGKSVAIIGSGPAGLAVAQQLARAGHDVVVFEKSDRIGGLLRYGIPDFKLDKKIIDRRLEQLKAEGVEFQMGVSVGEDISTKYLRKMFDVICLTIGSGEPRDLTVEGRELENVVFAMDFLTQQNSKVAGDKAAKDQRILAKDKVVAVIGGGDTGSDCVGTSIRQGAKEVYQFEILPEPPKGKNPQTPWPDWPRILRTSSSHEEGCKRRWSVMTKQLSGRSAHVEKLHGVEVDWTFAPDGTKMTEREGTEFSIPVDLVIIAMGFVHPVQAGLVEQMQLALDGRGNVKVDENFMTSSEGIFAAGDASQGASLVVHAIRAGRDAAAAIDNWLS